LPRSFAFFQFSKPGVRQPELLIYRKISHIRYVLWSNASTQPEPASVLVIHLVEGLCLFQSLEGLVIETCCLVALAGAVEKLTFNAVVPPEPQIHGIALGLQRDRWIRFDNHSRCFFFRDDVVDCLTAVLLGGCPDRIPISHMC